MKMSKVKENNAAAKSEDIEHSITDVFHSA